MIILWRVGWVLKKLNCTIYPKSYLLNRNSRYKLIQGSPGGAKGWALIEAVCKPKGTCDVIKQSILNGDMIFYGVPEEVEKGLDDVEEDSGEVMLFDLIGRCFVHDDVIKWKHFPPYWPFVRGIHRSPVNSPHKGQWRGALMFSLICVWINGWVNNRETGD